MMSPSAWQSVRLAAPIAIVSQKPRDFIEALLGQMDDVRLDHWAKEARQLV